MRSASNAANLDKAVEPPAGKRRPGRPTLTNEQLLDKALDLFLEQGFERTSIDAITAAAGMAKRTVYLRYGDKEALFRAALLRAIEDWIIPIEQLRAAESADLEQTLLDVGRVLVSNIMRPEGLRLLRITNAESVRMPEIGAYTYRHGTERTIVYLSELLRRRIGPETITMSAWREAAIAFLYLVVCGPPTMAAWGMTIDDDAVDRHTAYGVRLFLHGLLPRPQGEQQGTGTELGGDNPAMAGSDLQAENRRLRDLLVEAMLENASLRAQLANGAASADPA